MLSFKRIYFDSEPLVASGWPSLSAKVQVVLNLAQSLGVSTYMPHAVREELEAGWCANLQRNVKALRKAADVLNRGLRAVGSHFELGTVPTTDESVEAYRGRVDATIEKWKLQTVDFASMTATDFFRLALARKAPFHEDTDEGFKDSMILISVIEHLEHDPAPSVLVTKDRRFAKAEVPTLAKKAISLRLLPLEAVENELVAALETILQRAWEEDRQKAWAAITSAWPALSEFVCADLERLREALGLFSVVGKILSVTPTFLVEVTTPFPPTRAIGESVMVAAEIEADIEYIPSWYVEQPEAQAAPKGSLYELLSAPTPQREGWVLTVEASVPFLKDGYGQPTFVSLRAESRKAMWSSFRKLLLSADEDALQEDHLAKAYRESVARGRFEAE